MNSPFDDLIVTDTSPLITLAIADHLHALTAPRIGIVRPQLRLKQAPMRDGGGTLLSIEEIPIARHPRDH